MKQVRRTLIVVLLVLQWGCRRPVAETPTSQISHLAEAASPLTTPEPSLLEPSTRITRPSITPSATATVASSSTPQPTFSPEAIPPAALAKMVVREPAASGTSFQLVRLSQTPLGVVDLE
jgi:hypothetical protein